MDSLVPRSGHRSLSDCAQPDPGRVTDPEEPGPSPQTSRSHGGAAQHREQTLPTAAHRWHSQDPSKPSTNHVPTATAGGPPTPLPPPVGRAQTLPEEERGCRTRSGAEAVLPAGCLAQAVPTRRVCDELSPPKACATPRATFARPSPGRTVTGHRARGQGRLWVHGPLHPKMSTWPSSSVKLPGGAPGAGKPGRTPPWPEGSQRQNGNVPKGGGDQAAWQGHRGPSPTG